MSGKATPNSLIPNTAHQAGLIRAITECLQSLFKITTTNPTVNDDVDAGYQINSRWINTTDNGIFVCVDSTVGAAVWVDMLSAASIKVLTLGTATYDDVQDFINTAWSMGLISGGVLSDGGGGSVDVSAAVCFGRVSDSPTSEVRFFDVAADSLAVPADSTRFVQLDYNGGVPGFILSTTEDPDVDDIITIGSFTREGADVHVVQFPDRAGNIPKRLSHWAKENFGLTRAARQGGLILGETGTRNVTMSAGHVHYGLESYDPTAKDTSASDTFDTYYDDNAGGFTKTAGATQWPNTQYDDGSGTLATMTNNRWANLWFYIDVEDDLLMVYGTDEYTSEAKAGDEGTPTNVPMRISTHSLLIGRMVFQKSAATASIQTAFNGGFHPAGVSSHGDLADLTNTDDHTQYLPVDGSRDFTGAQLRLTNGSPDVVFVDADGRIFVEQTTGGAILYLDAMADDGLGVSQIRFFRATNTTGVKQIIIYEGDGTTTVAGRLGTGGINSYLQLTGGNFGLGTNNPGEMLDVVGNIAVSGTVDGRDVDADGTKLDGVEALAEVNNISDANATDLTDGGETSLHSHAAGAWVLLETKVPTVATTLTFTGFIDPAYTNYKIKFSGIRPTTNVQQLSLRFGTTGSYTIDDGASSYAWAWRRLRVGLAADGASDVADSEIELNVAQGNDAGEVADGTIELFDLSGAVKSSLSCSLQYTNDLGVEAMVNGSGWFLQTTAITAIQLLWEAGSTFQATGEVSLYGLRS